MKVVTIGSISEQVRGVSYSKEDASDIPGKGKFPILRANNIGEHGLALEDLVYVPEGKISQKQRLLPNDVVIAASSGSIMVVGKSVQVRKPFSGSFGAFCKVLRPNSSVDPHYFGHYFRTPTYRRIISSLAAGANINNLKNEHLDNLEIPLPPLTEQKRIAAILDAADALRAKRRESIAQLDSLLQATFLEMFGDTTFNTRYPAVPMRDLVAKFIDYRGKSPEKCDAGIPLITAKIIKEKEVKEPKEFIPADSYDAWMRRGIPSSGDVILTTEAPMGEVALVPRYKAAFAQRLLVLQPKKSQVNAIYLMWALTMPFVKKQMDQRSTGSTVTGIRSKEFKEVLLPLPPLDLQAKFATIVESIDRQKVRLRAHLTELDALFASLQSRAFNGEL